MEGIYRQLCARTLVLFVGIAAISFATPCVGFCQANASKPLDVPFSDRFRDMPIGQSIEQERGKPDAFYRKSKLFNYQPKSNPGVSRPNSGVMTFGSLKSVEETTSFVKRYLSASVDVYGSGVSYQSYASKARELRRSGENLKWSFSDSRETQSIGVAAASSALTAEAGRFFERMEQGLLTNRNANTVVAETREIYGTHYVSEIRSGVGVGLLVSVSDLSLVEQSISREKAAASLNAFFANAEMEFEGKEEVAKVVRRLSTSANAGIGGSLYRIVGPNGEKMERVQTTEADLTMMGLSDARSFLKEVKDKHFEFVPSVTSYGVQPIYMLLSEHHPNLYRVLKNDLIANEPILPEPPRHVSLSVKETQLGTGHTSISLTGTGVSVLKGGHQDETRRENVPVMAWTAPAAGRYLVSISLQTVQGDWSRFRGLHVWRNNRPGPTIESNSVTLVGVIEVEQDDMIHISAIASSGYTIGEENSRVDLILLAGDN